MTYGTVIPWDECYRDVARMRLDIEVISDDIEFTKNGGSIVYAVDTNTICFYADPLNNIEFSRIFADDDNTLLQGLSIVLGEFLFIRGLLSEADQACLLLPMPMLDEFLDLYDHSLIEARMESIKTHAHADEEKINEIAQKLNNYKKQPNEATKNEFIDYLIKNCSDLIKYLSPYDYESNTGILQRFGNIGKLSRLRNLDSEKRIYIPDKKVIKETEEWKTWDKFFRNVINNDAEDNKNNRDYTSRTNNNIESDIDTLALIATINKTQESLKIIYISCDKLVHKASKNMQESFGRDFLRQPHQYIPFIRFDGLHKTPQDKRVENIKKFKQALDDFLSPLRLSMDNYVNTLYEIINISTIYDINTKINPFRDIQNTKHYYNDLKNARNELLSLNSLLNESHVHTPHEMANNLTINLLNDNNIQQMLLNKQEEAFGQTTNLFSEIGIGKNVGLYAKEIIKYLDSVNEHKGNARGPVTLRRHPYKGGDDFFERIHRHVYNQNWNDLWDIMKISSTYIRELIIALTAADANEWKQAKEHCERALENEETNNNEGLYFLAIALRHTCESSNNYQKAKDKLNKFQEVWEHRYGPKGSEGIERPDYRFESEKLSLETAYFNYRAYQEGWDDNNVRDKPNFINTWDNLIKFDKSIDEIEEKQLDDIVRSRIKRQIYSSKCCLFLIDQYINEYKNIDKEDGRQAYEDLFALSQKPDFRSSYFINFLIAFNAWHFKKNKDTLDEALRNTRLALRESKIPYEDPKYRFFQKKLLDEMNA